MATEAAVREALKSVRDPELNRNIVDLDMVRRVDIEGTRVRVEVALTVAGCPLHAQIAEDITAALKRLDGVRDVSVTLGVMDEAERRRAFQRAFGQPASAPPRSAETGSGRRFQVQLEAAPPDLLKPETRTRLIGVASGKGGVGKSTVTANLAVALAQRGRRVGLMDMDIYGFSQGRLLGVHSEPTLTPDQKIRPWEAYGVAVVSMGMFVPEGQAVIWRGPMLGKVMDQFFADVAWGDLDYLIIDLPPGTGDVALDIAQKVRHAALLLVTTPQPVATEVAQRAAMVAIRTDQALLGVVENMSYLVCPHGTIMEPFGHGGGEALAALLGVPLLARIPMEPAVRAGGDDGRPIVVSAPDSEAGRAFYALADHILALQAEPVG
jgi:ATP-binding protein involved in chromosome partitioning